MARLTEGIITTLTILCVGIIADESFENSTNLCDNRCGCTTSNNIFEMKCDQRQMENVLANWPTINASSIVEVKASFAYNNVTVLKTLPALGAVRLIVSFAHNQINELRSAVFADCANVNALDLSHNQIPGDQLATDVFRGQYSNQVYEPIALEHLDLSYNQIQSLRQNLFEHMPNLTHLNLAGNLFRILDSNTRIAFTTLTSLSYFNLASNRLILMPNGTMAGMVNLQSLDISVNDLPEVPDDIISLGHTLRELKIDHNPIFELTNETFYGMGALVTISASGLGDLDILDSDTFKTTVNLQKIDLSQSTLDSHLTEYLFNNTQFLREVNLSGCHLKTLPAKLLNWGELKMLDLSDNPFYCLCELKAIIAQLSPQVRAQNRQPYCLHYPNYRTLPVYTMEECFDSAKLEGWLNPNLTTERKILRITLVLLTMVLIVLGTTASWIGYMKYARYRRNNGYGFTSASVVYNPIGALPNEHLIK